MSYASISVYQEAQVVSLPLRSDTRPGEKALNQYLGHIHQLTTIARVRQMVLATRYRLKCA